MNTQKKKLTLDRETLRDLTAQNGAGVKGGIKLTKANSKGKVCPTGACTGRECYSVGCW